MLKFISLLLVLVCIGCAEEVTRPGDQEDMRRVHNLQSTLVIDPSLSTAELDAIFAASDAWTEATQGKVKLTFVIGEIGKLPNTHVVLRAPVGRLPPAELAATGSTFMFLSDELRSSPHMDSALVHEFGHYFGLGHEPDLPDDIMYPDTHVGMPTAPTADALDDLKVLYGW